MQMQQQPGWWLAVATVADRFHEQYAREGLRLQLRLTHIFGNHPRITISHNQIHPVLGHSNISVKTTRATPLIVNVVRINACGAIHRKHDQRHRVGVACTPDSIRCRYW